MRPPGLLGIWLVLSVWSRCFSLGAEIGLVFHASRQIAYVGILRDSRLA
jgi:hypothetical protein